MAIEFVVIEVKKTGPQKKAYKVALKDGNQYRLAEAIVTTGQAPTGSDLQAAWNAGVSATRKQFEQYELRDTDDINREIVDAIFEVGRANGTLAQMNTAALAVLTLETHPRQRGMYNRIASALEAATATERWKFIALLSTVAYAKIGQR